MSMGPKNQVEKTELSRFDRIRYGAKKITETYFNRPLYYLFYGLLLVTAVALLFSVILPWQYYILLMALALTQLYNWAWEKEKK